MRAKIWVAATAVLFAAPLVFAAQQTSSAPAQPQSQTKTQPAPAQESPVVAAALKARKNQKSAQTAPVVFTNENLPKSSPMSVVGSTTQPDARAEAQSDAADAKADEKMWRQKFADARFKLQQDREKLSMLQSEFNALGMVRYFNEADAVSKQQAVADQQKEINEDQKAIDDLQEALRKAGGDPAWAR
ncbi:MAG: hypothetical protein WA611_17895 [Candidatus Acidiferrales bacterium]